MPIFKNLNLQMDISSNDRSAMMPNYSFPDLVPEKASGSRLWDENGKEYIDFGGGIAVTSLGHCHPELMKSMEEQSKKLWHVSNYLLSKPAKELGKKLLQKVLPIRFFLAIQAMKQMKPQLN